MTVLAKHILFTLTLSNMFLAKDTLQLKMLYGYPKGKYCQYSSQRSLCYEAKKKETKKQKTKKKNRDLMNLL